MTDYVAKAKRLAESLRNKKRKDREAGIKEHEVYLAAVKKMHRKARTALKPFEGLSIRSSEKGKTKLCISSKSDSCISFTAQDERDRELFYISVSTKTYVMEGKAFWNHIEYHSLDKLLNQVVKRIAKLL